MFALLLLAACGSRVNRPAVVQTFELLDRPKLVDGVGPTCAVIVSRFRKTPPKDFISLLYEVRDEGVREVELEKGCQSATWTRVYGETPDILCRQGNVTWRVSDSEFVHTSPPRAKFRSTPITSTFGTYFYTPNQFFEPGGSEPFIVFKQGQQRAYRSAFQVSSDHFVVGWKGEDDQVRTPHLLNKQTQALTPLPVGQRWLRFGWSGHVLAQSKTDAIIYDIDSNTTLQVDGLTKAALAWELDGTVYAVSLQPNGEAAFLRWSKGNGVEVMDVPDAMVSVSEKGLCLLTRAEGEANGLQGWELQMLPLR